MNIEELKRIDYWTPEMYQEYYLKLIPFYKDWYSVVEGYRPVVMGRNIAWWLKNGEIRRKCNRKLCKKVDNSKEDCNHKILDSFYDSKMGHWICEIDENNIENEKNEENNKKKKRFHSLSSGWIRYYDIFNKVLWNIDRVTNNIGILKTIRSIYWQPAIRDYKLIDIACDKSWNEIVGENFVIDIDIINKNIRTIFDNEIWSNVYDMMSLVSKMLEDEDIDYKIQFSGNGIYFITKRIIEKDERMENESREQFWNIISAGWTDWVNEELKKKVEEKYGNFFDVEGESPYTMKFYKSPFSLHQRIDYSAIPINLDMMNGISSDDFKVLSEPNYVKDNWQKILGAWK